MTRTAYKNQHIKEHYDRINYVIPKGEKYRIKDICSDMGASVNEYLYMLVCNDLADGTSRMALKSRDLMQNRNGCLKNGKCQENIMK